MAEDAKKPQEETGDGPADICDILKDSSLPQGLPIRDITRHLSDTEDLSLNILAQIPFKTRESFVESMVMNRLPGLSESQGFLKGALNEILPLLFVSLKLSLEDFATTKPKMLLLLQNLDDFVIHDGAQ